MRIFWLPLAREAFIRAHETNSAVNGALAETCFRRDVMPHVRAAVHEAFGRAAIDLAAKMRDMWR